MCASRQPAHARGAGPVPAVSGGRAGPAEIDTRGAGIGADRMGALAAGRGVVGTIGSGPTSAVRPWERDDAAGWDCSDLFVSPQPAEHQHGAAYPPHVVWRLRAHQDDSTRRPPTTRFTVCPARITEDGPSSSLMIASCSSGMVEGYCALNCSSVICRDTFTNSMRAG